MPSSMTVSQASTVLNGIVSQATGQSVITDIATPADFVSVAQTALLTGYDPIINAISQMWSRTIFSSRPYRGAGNTLEMDMPTFGNALRKLSPIARQMVDDAGFVWPVAYNSAQTTNPLGNGESVDMYKINKQEAIQTNFYGKAVWQQDYTIFKDQLKVAFSDMNEFSRFNSMMMEERANDRESFREAVAVGMQANFIGAILNEGQSSRIVHLLTEYNTLTGLTLTATTVYQPDNFKGFAAFVVARFKEVARLMSKRSQMFQTVINEKPVLRHTPPERLRLAMYATTIDQINASVLSDIYHDEYLQFATHETVPYWQSIETPDSIAVTPVYTDTTGAVKTATVPVEQAGIFAIMHDRDALGYAFTMQDVNVSPLNIKGRYWNECYNAEIKTLQDNTEKAVVFLMD